LSSYWGIENAYNNQIRKSTLKYYTDLMNRITTTAFPF
jgi:hypothetical protein